nr:hypothetical protein [Tanacetum cinerariifolium]
MVAILEKGEFNSDFHPMVDFIAASPLRYALTVKPTIFVSHIRQFWSTARIETTGVGTYILATVDGIQRTVSESSLRQYTRRARIAQSSALPTVADEPASPVRDVSEGEACLTKSGFIADQDRATIAKSSTLPHDLAPRVTSPATDEGSTQHHISKLTALCTSLTGSKYWRIKRCCSTQSGDDAPIKGRSINEGEAAAKRISNDSEEGKEVMVESDTPKKKKLQEQIDAQVARELEEQQEKENMRMNEQIARDAEVARVHAEEELQGMIDSLDKLNETIAKYLQEYQDFALELPLEKRIELISNLKREYYMAVIKSNLGWRFKDFKGMTFEEIEVKFDEVWKHVKEFIPMGPKEETERLKRKGLNLEKEQVKKQNSSEEAPEIKTSTEEFIEEKMKEMMQLIIRLGGSSACYQFFVDLLKQLDREDLNQLWALVKEYLSIRSATNDKEMELWVELKRMYELDPEGQL